jgi:hypothetical protein
LVAPADVEPEVCSEQSADVASFDATAIVLRIDHEDACLAHHHVIDVRVRAWDPTVVQDGDVLCAELVEALADCLFAARASCPRGRRLWVAGESEKKPAEMLVLGADARFPLLVTALPLARG